MRWEALPKRKPEACHYTNTPYQPFWETIIRHKCCRWRSNVTNFTVKIYLTMIFKSSILLHTSLSLKLYFAVFSVLQLFRQCHYLHWHTIVTIITDTSVSLPSLTNHCHHYNWHTTVTTIITTTNTLILPLLLQVIHHCNYHHWYTNVTTITDTPMSLPSLTHNCHYHH